jgi:hypothetical protein
MENSCGSEGFRQGSPTSLAGEGRSGYSGAPHQRGGRGCGVGCGSQAVAGRPERTARGYRRFRCRACGTQWNERAGTVLNRAQYPSDVIALVVPWRLRYKLNLRDLPEMFAVRGMAILARAFGSTGCTCGRET